MPIYNKGIEDLEHMPNGTTVMYRNKYYWLSKGLTGRILTGTDGNWYFVDKLKWKTFWLVYRPRSVNG